MSFDEAEVHRMVRAAAQNKLNLILKEREGQSLESTEIEAIVAKMASAFDVQDQVAPDRLVAELEEIFQTIIGVSRVLRGDDEAYAPWLSKRKATISWRFWERYETYLLEEAARPQAVLDRLDESTDEVLGLLTAPDRDGTWDRRGLVVGHVQSGKTSHYTGLICKAADAGYRLIVVLAGFHKSLRSQTQIRLEEGFLGYDRGETVRGDSSAPALVGVGKYDSQPRADSITTRADDGDFKRAVARQFGIRPGGNPLLFVVKKNGSVLRNLLRWVESVTTTTDDKGRPYVRGVPLLVIDDEADLGSIDTKVGVIDEEGRPDEEHNPSVLNERVRRLLHLFEQSAYVGYTATPFANILIHESGRTEREGEDLFPRSFIFSLPAPSDYVGPAAIFGYEDEDGNQHPGLPIIRRVADHAESEDRRETQGWMPPRHNKHHIPLYEGVDRLPPSLVTALRGFVLGCAARAARGQDDAHNSMLIHVTRFTAVQALVAEQVRKELADLRRRWRYGDGGSKSQLHEEFRRQWEEGFAPVSAEIVARGGRRAGHIHDWSEIESFVEAALLSLSIRIINGAAGDVLDYEKHSEAGLNVIAVGGDKLSRGLTLEGLSVSYFLRASRMYDTLMQMGRWFGYRPRYLDLCRLYTTREMERWFFHIAQASEELREEFNRMVASGGSPTDFGLRVRSHPLMLVTSRVKSQHGSKIDISFDGDISETINFWRTRERLSANWDAAIKLVGALGREGLEPQSEKAGSDAWVWKGAGADAILDFLSEYQEHSVAKKVKTKPLAEYIRKEVSRDRLIEWSVLLASGQSKRHYQIGPVRFRMIDRSWHPSSERYELIRQGTFNVRRLVSPSDELVDLSPDEQVEALRRTVEQWKRDPGDRREPRRPSGPQIREIRDPTKGLLLLYAIDGSVDEKIEADASEVPVLGFAISFPYVDPSSASKVTYVVNNVYWNQEFEEPQGGMDD